MTSIMGAEPADTYSMINFEETELRLGLPGGVSNGNDAEAAKGNGKRGFSETVDLKLNLSTKETGKDGSDQEKAVMKEKTVAPRPNDPAKPPSKRVVRRCAPLFPPPQLDFSGLWLVVCNNGKEQNIWNLYSSRQPKKTKDREEKKGCSVAN